MGRTRRPRKEGGWQTTDESGRVTRGVPTRGEQEETSEGKTEMGGLWRDVRKAREEEDRKKKARARGGWKTL